MEQRYVGRFAPSPTGPLHMGSLVAAVASHDDARAHGGRWLLRIEDVDGPRCLPQATETILTQLQTLGLQADEPVLVQSQRHVIYQRALQQLIDKAWAYPCACSRSDIERALLAAGVNPQRHASAVYPGTCRLGLGAKTGRAWRQIGRAHV